MRLDVCVLLLFALHLHFAPRTAETVEGVAYLTLPRPTRETPEVRLRAEECIARLRVR